jgi:hypothetical protein
MKSNSRSRKGPPGRPLSSRTPKTFGAGEVEREDVQFTAPVISNRRTASTQNAVTASSDLIDTDLKTLPPHVQAELAEFLLEHTLAETVDWLAEKGIGASHSALSLFYAAHTTREQLLRFEAMVALVTEELARQDPSLTPERIRELGQSLFTRLAIEKRDAAFWKITQELELKRSKLDLEWQKFRAHLAKIETDAEALEKPDGLSPETTEKIERELKLF